MVSLFDSSHLKLCLQRFSVRFSILVFLCIAQSAVLQPLVYKINVFQNQRFCNRLRNKFMPEAAVSFLLNKIMYFRISGFATAFFNLFLSET